MKRFMVLALALGFTGCTLDKQSAPPLIGPSELGLSVGLSATPDVITQDGQSQATIQVNARDAASQPVGGLTLRAEIYVGNTPIDFGVLSAKVFSTGADGGASFTYRAPAAPPPTAQSDTLVTILVTPVGSNYAGSVPREVQIRLARPGVIIPPGDGPVPAFFFSPTSPNVGEDVTFDGSSSTGNIVSYTWSFGDGRTETSSAPTIRHRYDVTATYSVTLTVKDNLGRVVTSKPSDVKVSALAGPTASFVFSPQAPKAGDIVFFNGSLSKAATTDHTLVQYRWDFGDGSPIVASGSPQASHQYAGSATTSVNYTVVLTVVDDGGREASTSSGITVAKP